MERTGKLSGLREFAMLGEAYTTSLTIMPVVATRFGFHARQRPDPEALLRLYLLYMNDPHDNPLGDDRLGDDRLGPDPLSPAQLVSHATAASPQADRSVESIAPVSADIPTVRSGAIPPATASRLGLYLRELQHFLRGGTETIKSNSLGHRLGLSDSQIRRDLALFGEFGKRGVGYNVAGLVGALRKALGTDGRWNTILIGLGNLGNALVRYRGFQQQGFFLTAIFEADPRKFGVLIESHQINGVPVYDAQRLEELVPGLNVQMAILAVPAEAAQSLVNRLAVLGISGILNFAPVSLSVPPGIQTVDVDLAVELQRLAFAVVNDAQRDPPTKS